jgi:hypothetical protein
VTEVIRGEHPPEVVPFEPPVMRVVREIVAVIPIEETVAKGRQERGERG